MQPKGIEDIDFSDFDFTENLDDNGEVKCLAPPTLKKTAGPELSPADFKKAVIFFKTSPRFCDFENAVLKRFARIYCLFFSKQPIEELDFQFDVVKLSVQVRKIYEQTPDRIDSESHQPNEQSDGFGDSQNLV